jgi:hypothetical protein
MITNAILELLYLILYAFTAPLRAFGDVVLPAAFAGAISTASTYISSLNEFLPITSVISVLSAVLVIEAAVFLYKTIMWVLKRFPTQS